MNWKIIIGGGLVYYVVIFVIGMVSGQILHEGILDHTYMAHQEFWRPELNQDPPDMAALMPRWITTGLLSAFVVAGFYGVVRSAFTGSGWQRGMKYGLALGLLWCTMLAGWSGLFNLPDKLWLWWGAESLVYALLGGAALGWFADRFSPAT